MSTIPFIEALFLTRKKVALNSKPGSRRICTACEAKGWVCRPTMLKMRTIRSPTGTGVFG